MCTGNEAKRARVHREVTYLLRRLAKFKSSPLPPRPPLKEGVITNTEIPECKDYKLPQSKEFWHKFPSDLNLRGGSPFKLDTEVIDAWVRRAGSTWELVSLWEEVKVDILKGCDLKVSDDYKPTVSPNCPSAYKEGRFVTDEIASGIKKGIICGPIPTRPVGATISSIQTAPKPNGKIRLIVNMSAPKDKSVNDHINSKDYPSRMGGLPEIVRALNYCGRGALFFKCDYNAAYKHLAVRHDQLNFQYFKWLHMYFVEKCLIFGNSNSVGLYDRFARLMWVVVATILNYPRAWIIQHLDDLCVIGPSDGVKIKAFYKMYTQFCAEAGVSLQDPKEASEDKAYDITHCASMLGVWFNTKSWRWWLASDKVNRYINDLDMILHSQSVKQHEVWSSVGKILYVSCLIPESKYYTSELIRANMGTDRNADVVITRRIREQIRWWIPMVQLVGEGLPIPPTYNTCPPLADEADTDAAGGSLNGVHGVGIVKGNAWAFLEWPPYINSKHEKCVCGAKFRHKLSYLELIGHLLHLSVFPEDVMDRAACTFIDNSGTVRLMVKGRSVRCRLMDSLIKACNYVAIALGCRAYVLKVTRCSTVKAEAADAISKNDTERFRRLCPNSEYRGRPIPVTIRNWIKKPVVDMELGKKIVVELASKGVKCYDSMV